ncbi:hypothetical protein CEUSTIGMA_g2575.t1 [Chlamydomonas eustigma]|uniref:J domain-containing protein n=1 Tax=Chlamydomonas eustigma TaxID=1157962 RepID=A0A250WWD5_9CHLO|nr:hypothetical protein CEUSTIGMA_g2575.t1 [Chlamydomonas eustigma]|eukprot:GAX75131.1 hypothetical protein CEUSTIGMA_g2575.t1 [Chlamydomonas eustigma]
MLRLRFNSKNKSTCRSLLSFSGRETNVGSVRLAQTQRFQTRAILEDVSGQDSYGGESFYDILGVTPDADVRDIKRAYYSIMRDCHPDQSGDYEETNEFCKMLNEIYETLSDPARREVYDDLAGYSMTSTNPFMRSTHERDLVFVDEFSCIGCRNCNNVCPKTFAIEEEWGRARVMKQRVDSDEKLQEAMDTCPVSCIHWVSAPQLSLLEASMARMERVAVWSLMSGGGANVDVFNEASIAWEKRYAAMQNRRDVMQAATTGPSSGVQNENGNNGSGGLGGFWGRMSNTVVYESASGSRMYEQAARARKAEQQQQQQQRGGDAFTGSGSLGPKEARGIASLAARAARASRTWKVYQDLEKSKRGGSVQLTAVSSASSLDEEDLIKSR